MLLTDRFTYIHEPKTGGTFVAYVLRELHGDETYIPPSRRVSGALRVRAPTASFLFERSRASMPRATGASAQYGPFYRWNDHGTCNEIPRSYRSRRIVASVRNPLQTYVSGYLFGWWKRPEYLPLYHRKIPEFHSRFPTFPELSFIEYLEVLHEAWTASPDGGFYDEAALGFQSERFIRFYFRTPWLARGTRYELRSIAPRLRRGDLLRGGRPRGMFDVRFLHTDSLNDELHQFLVEVGYDPNAVKFVETLRPVVPVGGADVDFVDRATSHDWISYYTAELASVIRAKDGFLFALFPEFDEDAPARAS